jgi:hypothetical protein
MSYEKTGQRKRRVRCKSNEHIARNQRYGGKIAKAIASIFLSFCVFTLGLGASVHAQAQIRASQFYRFDIAVVAPQSIADFAFLNAPLTEGDRLTVCGQALCKKGASTPIRLFGVNLGFDAAFPGVIDAARLAARLRSLGVNFVRLHALDSISAAQKATGLLTNAPFPTLNDNSIERLRNLLDQLRSNGIYVDLNLHVMYQFRPTIDGTLSLSGEQALPNQSKPFLIIDDAAVRLQAQYATKLLRALTGAGDPALAVVEINNESSLVYSWMNGDLDRTVTGPYRGTLTEKWQRFCRVRGIAKSDVDTDLPSLRGDDQSQTSHTFLQFLTHEDKQYTDTIAAAIRNVDPRVLIIGTQMSFGGLPNFQSMSNMDILDNHFYVDHYVFPHRMWQWDDWQISDTSNIGTGLKPLLGSAYYRSFKKPFLITEFNQPWPNRQSSEILSETTAFASLQDWSGIALYDYTHSGDAYTPSGPREFSLAGDLTKLVQFGQSAWVFRTRAISSLRPEESYAVTDKLTFDAVHQRITNGLSVFLGQQRVVDPTRALSARVGYGPSTSVAIAAGRAGDAVAIPAARFQSSERQMIVDAPTVKGITGYLTRNTTYDYGSFQVRLHNNARGFISLTLSARDGHTIALSQHLLLTLPGYTVGMSTASHGLDPLDLTRAAPSAKDFFTGATPLTLLDPATDHIVSLRSVTSPIWMERIPCSFAFISAARKLRVYPLDSSGLRESPLDERFVQKTTSGFEIDLQAEAQSPSPWYELQAEF